MKSLTGIVNKSLDNILLSPSSPRGKKSRNSRGSEAQLRNSLLGHLIRLEPGSSSIRRTTEAFEGGSALSPRVKMKAAHFSLKAERERAKDRKQFKEYLKSEDFISYLDSKELARVEKLEEQIIRDVTLFSSIPPPNQGKYAREEEKREEVCARLLKKIGSTHFY